MDSINRDKEHEEIRLGRQQADTGGEGVEYWDGKEGEESWILGKGILFYF